MGKAVKVTGTNLFAMAKWVLAGSPKSVSPGEARHIKRCIQAGLIDDSLKVTPAGVQALASNYHATCKAAASKLKGE